MNSDTTFDEIEEVLQFDATSICSENRSPYSRMEQTFFVYEYKTNHVMLQLFLDNSMHFQSLLTGPVLLAPSLSPLMQPGKLPGKWQEAGLHPYLSSNHLTFCNCISSCFSVATCCIEKINAKILPGLGCFRWTFQKISQFGKTLLSSKRCCSWSKYTKEEEPFLQEKAN